MSAVVLISGGLDSAVAAGWAAAKYDVLYMIAFDYGQRNREELRAAVSIAQHFKALSFRVFKLDFVAEMTKSAMTDNDMAFSDEGRAPGIGNRYVPNRNMIFMAAAHGYADTVGAEAVVTGIGGRDEIISPDSKPRFVRAFRKALRAGNPIPIRIETPLLGKYKQEVWAMADKLGMFEFARSSTISCQSTSSDKVDKLVENYWGKGCGTCPACALRREGFDTYLRRTKLARLRNYYPIGLY